MTLPVSDIVNVTILVTANPPAQPSFSGGLLLGTTQSRLPLHARVQAVTVDTLADFYSASDPEYVAASMYFAQNPAPDTVYMAAPFTSAQAGYLRGGSHSVLATLKGITAGAFDVTVDSTLIHVTALDLSGAADLDACAALIQTKLQVGLASTLCIYDDSNVDVNGPACFKITSPTTGIASQVSHASIAGAPASTAATLLGLTADAGASRTVGIALETVTDALNASKVFSSAWYSLATIAGETFANQKLVGAWAESNERPYFVTTNASSALAAPIESDTATDIAQHSHFKGWKFPFTLYSTDTLYAAISAMARINVVDYTAADSTITLKGKQLPGVGAEALSETQRLLLDAINCNYYATFGTYTMLAEGWQSDGTFTDQVIGLAWLKAGAQTAVFAALMTNPTKVPQTNAGVHLLETALETFLRQAVNNGFAAPGYWPATNSQVGPVKPGDFLEKGYRVFADPVETQLVADRAARRSPPIGAVVCGAGAIHGCAVTINFQP